MKNHSIPVTCTFVSCVVLKPTPQGERVLLLRRSDMRLEGCWFQVAGGIEEGERAWQTAIREVHEETGLVPHTLYSGDIVEQFYDIERDRINVAPVFVAYVDEDAHVTLNEEHTDYCWVDFDEAHDMVPFPGQRNIMQEIKETFVDRTPLPYLHIKAYSPDS